MKPDVLVRRFAEAAVGCNLDDRDVIELTTGQPERIGIEAFGLDWRIWDAARKAGARGKLGLHLPR